MNVLIVVGAGASYDCWAKHVPKPPDYNNYRLPLAKELFYHYPQQSLLIQEYDLLDIASQLRSKANSLGDKFDIEDELLKISKRANKINDINTLHSLFKTRFYLQRLITSLTLSTINRTYGHTDYIDLIRKLKYWIEDAPEDQDRIVDIVNFNYDTLLETAIENHYSVDWRLKNEENQMSAYYRGRNLRIYKPHGSINWGRVVQKNGGNKFNYLNQITAFKDFNNLTIQNIFRYMNPENFYDNHIPKDVIPAIAIPFKEKTTFDECPQFMLEAMVEAINNADYIITLGWKGAEKNFTKLLLTNGKKIKAVYVVSPSAETNLSTIFPEGKIQKIESTFSYFVSQTVTLEAILKKLQ